MSLIFRTVPLASRAALPAVVWMIDPGLGSARARRAASATRPATPEASKDRRSMHSPPREERSFMAVLPIADQFLPGCVAGAVAAGAVVTGAARGCSTRPSSLTALTHAAAGRPSRIGRPVTVTLSPG